MVFVNNDTIYICFYNTSSFTQWYQSMGLWIHHQNCEPERETARKRGRKPAERDVFNLYSTFIIVHKSSTKHAAFATKSTPWRSTCKCFCPLVSIEPRSSTCINQTLYQMSCSSSQDLKVTNEMEQLSNKERSFRCLTLSQKFLSSILEHFTYQSD